MHIPEPAKRKIDAIARDGADQMHVIADFDRTLTPNFVHGEKTSTSFAQFRNGGYLGDDYATEAHRLFDHYNPIEMDPKFPLDEKRAQMKEWWKRHLELLVKTGLEKNILEDIIAKEKIQLRDGAKDFFTFLSARNIPLLVLSAGVGDLISFFLAKQGLLTKNVHIISNFFEFDDAGKAIGVRVPVISTANKDESEIGTSPYFSQVRERRNVILLGDRVEDLQMSEGLEHETVLTIGFLNERADKERALFQQQFDIVLEDDGPLTPIVQLMGKIAS